MKLYAKAITTYNNVNSFKTGNQWAIRAGEENTLYFQLIDQDQDNLRYITGADVSHSPASMVVTFPALDDDAVITATATIVDVNDTSLWKVVLSDVQVPSSGNVSFALTEGTKTKRFSALQFLTVERVAQAGDCC